MGQKSSRNSLLETDPMADSSPHSATSVAFPLTDLPDDMLAEVFLRLPARYLVTCCVRVCKHWNDLISTQKLWKDKFLRDYCVPLEVMSSLGAENFKHLYFKNPYISNLIRNPDASEGMKHWKIISCGGNGFHVERQPDGCHAVPDEGPVPGMKHWKVISNGGNGFRVEEQPSGCHAVPDEGSVSGRAIGCWSTSYGKCEKEQLIDLLEKGCHADILDNVRPDIIVSEKYAARFDCGIKYSVFVELLSKEKAVLSEWTFTDTRPAGRDWFSTGFTFANYEPGVRFIRFTHEGVDTQFWAGYYGAKMTRATVKFDFAHKAGPWKPEAKPAEK